MITTATTAKANTKSKTVDFLSAHHALREDTQYVEKMTLHYALYEENGYYFIAVAKDGEPTVAPLGNEFPRAVAVYQMLVRCTVTPCTLHDIVRDLFYA